MIVAGHIENNIVVPESSVNLPDGTKVNIVIYSKEIENSSGLCGLWQDKRSPEEICNDIISSRSMGREINI